MRLLDDPGSLKSMSNKWPALIILFLFSISAITGGVIFFIAEKNRTIKEKRDELNAISSLKIEDLTRWRKEHFRDVRLLRDNMSLRRMILDFLEGNGDAVNLKNIFLPLTENYDYQSILLADTIDNIRFSTEDGRAYNTESSKYSFLSSDLFFVSDSTGILMDLKIDIPDPEGFIAGTLILRINPEIVLFPLIQSWPTPSKSSETLLLRKDGDSIIFLNDLRHEENTALKLKLPASDIDLPAAKVVSGYEGLFEGTDYRGVKVISYLRKVPDSPWFMVTKVDKAEIYSPLIEKVVLISLIVILLITTFSIITGIYFRGQRIKYLNEISITKDKLYSIITHDLRNPFVSIMGYSELLNERAQKNDYSRIKEFTSIIYNSSVNTIELLNNLTSWTKIQTGRTFFRPVRTDIVKLINDVIESCKPASLLKELTIQLSTPPELFLVVDTVMVSTIVRNLLLNAIKFSYHHSVVTVQVKKDTDIVEIIVGDSGIGIDSHTIALILSKGNYQSMPGTANEKGTGLGLFLCMEFIKMHEGGLNIESEPGKGSRFSVRFPAKD